ncbi:MAG TPA: hypothetical protein IAB30_03295 [Candidatus Fimenecus excrementavium]|nr:hypothetical protein [Candidatus Fimenecus excrementavium]
MAKKEKIELTPEERQARETRKKEKRKLFGDTFVRACVFFLAVAFVYSVTYVAFGQGTTIYQSVQASGTASGGSAGTSTGGSTSTDTAAPVSNEAEEAAKAINEATAAAAAAGYTWNRTSEFTKDIDVGGSTATNAINTVIQAVDSNANINSVVGGFIGIGTKDATIAKGADAATEIGYHGDSYKLKATSLEAADLQGLTKNGDTYTFTLANADTPKKDGATALNRLTDDIVTQEEVSAEIQEQVGSSITVSSLVGTYSNIKVEVTITDGKLQKLTYSYDAEVTELGLKVAILTVKGTGAMHTEATYSDFVY